MFRGGFTGLLALAIPVLMMVFPGSAGAGDSPIVGSWEVQTAQGAVQFVFNAGGNGSMNGVPFQWTHEGEELAITFEGNTVSYRAVVDEAGLHLSGGDLMTEMTLTKAGETPPPDTRLHGTWRGPDGSLVELHPDGSGMNQRGAFQYAASQGLLTFNDGFSTVLLAYRLDGEKLHLASNEGSVTFTRAAAGSAVPGDPGKPPAPAEVFVNRTKLSADEVRKLETQFRVRVIDGRYWYDAKCGAWGVDGGPCLGFLPPRLTLGGPLPADASGGGTGVFINGRDLHPMDVAALQKITPVAPGRYWVDEIGNCGFEGNSMPLANLVQLANAARASSGGSYHSRSDITGIGSGGDGKTSYVMGKDWSVIIGE